MARGVGRAVMATAAFAVVHSVLASAPVKRLAARVLGVRRRNALYRPFYIGQSLVASGFLFFYIARLPTRTVYRIEGGAARLLRIGQAAGVLWAAWAAWEVGLSGMSGLRSLSAWRARGPVPPEPEAQGPVLAADGEMRVAGPFRITRHPLNLAPVPVFWLAPHLTTRRLAFNLAATAYLVLGSLHEESRLYSAYGAAYARYMESGVPFYWPALLHVADRVRLKRPRRERAGAGPLSPGSRRRPVGRAAGSSSG